MLEKKEQIADASLLADAYEHWLSVYYQHDALRGITFHHSCFRDGVISSIQLFPKQEKSRQIKLFHSDIASALFHDWTKVGGDLWAAHVANTMMGGHGSSNSADESESTEVTKSR